MLEIIKIKKDYVLKDQTVEALKGVTIRFRRSEFVSILGPSGCGKTTLLNIIGGLDKYSDGDLMIDGISTKEYKDKDWDNYRNHHIGFVFQTYNLIPHQTVLENVELALTLSGVSKTERRERATEVLHKVGLSDKLKSKPNQLSGGQMQRVAIARALVNDPKIILADEPTGALDSKISLQIMDLLKEVSKDRLVLMVTHNPELANTYSSRIITLLDGELTDDSKPYSEKELQTDYKKHAAKLETEKMALENQEEGFKQSKRKRRNKTSMSFFTALALSFKNMMTKKGRTAMISFAGSIGIVGIALILAVSGGLTGYIDNMQSESLASYPLAISSLAVDYDAAINTMMNGSDNTASSEDGITVYNQQNMLMSMGKYNYLSSDFVSYVDEYYKDNNKMSYLNDIKISYASDMRFIAHNSDANVYTAINNAVVTSAMYGTTNSTFFEGLSNENYVLSLYNIEGGSSAHYPTGKNEVALVVGDDGRLDVSVLAKMGIGFETNPDGSYKPISYADIVGKTYKLILNNAYYNSVTQLPNVNFALLDNNETISEFYTRYTQSDLQNLYNDANTVELTISCVLKEKKDAKGAMYNSGIVYTPELGDYYHQNCKNSDVVATLVQAMLDIDQTFINGDLEFVNKYSFRISELSSYLSLDTGMFSYTTPNKMKTALLQNYDIQLTDEQVIDLYLQVYGASEVPTGIYLYAKSFEAKDDMKAMLTAWNDREGVSKIYYTDSSEFLSNMLSTLVNIISYVLIAFAAISLVVSSIMIAIITYTSVIERTKEIGILRSVGASKRDVSRVFNAETIIIGFAAGTLGVLLAALLCIPINLILKAFTGIAGLATLPLLASGILILISIGLTFVAGLFPARIASKKDPVLALRTE